MRPFLHDRLQRYERLLATSTAALRAYSDHDLDLAGTVVAALDEAAERYRSFGQAAGENELLALRAQFAAAREGVDPLTSQRVTGRRRELERTVALRVLLVAAERLRADHDAVQQTLTRTREQLAPLAVYALHKGLLVPGPDGTLTQADLERLWAGLLDDPETAATARRTALEVAGVDVVLVLADLLGSLSRS